MLSLFSVILKCSAEFPKPKMAVVCQMEKTHMSGDLLYTGY
jgi:hypothetical protein